MVHAVSTRGSKSADDAGGEKGAGNPATTAPALPHLLVLDAGQVSLRGRANDIENAVELVEVVLAGEERAPAQHLGQDAARRPNVNGLGVGLAVEHNLGRTVPARRDILW